MRSDDRTPERSSTRLVGTFVLLAMVLVLATCAGSKSARPAGRGGSGADGSNSAQSSASASCSTRKVERLSPEVIARIDHDPASYTQGLLVSDGVLYESSDQYGESRLSAVDIDNGRVTSSVALDPEVFGEGLAIGSGGELVQLTWKDGVAYRWSLDEIHSGGRPGGEFHYTGEGWGLTTLGDGSLLMSDGSDELVTRKPEDFSITGTHRISRSNGPADALNELEFDGTWIWANRYRTDEILRIDPECWTVTGVVDASALRGEADSIADAEGLKIDVLNGIAHLSGTDEFIVTGKWWPVMFRVRFVPR